MFCRKCKTPLQPTDHDARKCPKCGVWTFVEGTCDFAPNTPHEKCDNANWKPPIQTCTRQAIHQCKHCGQCTVERGWLIEKNLGGKPLWLTCNWSFGWTEDSTKSVRFSRREDAEQIATMFENEDISITEHDWE